MNTIERDVFLCHSTGDTESIVQPIVQAFIQAEITYWTSEEEILWGDSIVEKVNKGLKNSKYVIVILSSDFIEKEWAQRELNAVLNLEASSGDVRVLPLLVGSNFEKDEIKHQYPLLHDKLHLSWEGDPIKIVNAIRARTQKTKVSNHQNFSRKICMVSSEFPPHVEGGLGVHVHELTKALSQEVITEVNVVLPHLKDGYSRTNGHVKLWPMAKVTASYKDPVSWLRFSRHVPDTINTVCQPQVVHCHDWCTVLGGISYSRAFNVPLIFHLHLPSRSPLSASVMNLGLICADLVTVNSEYIKQELLGHMDIGEIRVIPNGVNTTRFFPATDWPNDAGYILFVGRLVEQKGVEFLLRSVLSIRERFPDVCVKIVGKGGYRKVLEHLVTSLGLSEHVEFVGWVSGDALADYYRRARIVVVPSIYEPFGMTALEGMAVRRPVIVARTGGLSSIVEHGKTGFCFEPQDHLDLAQWTMTLLASETLRQKIGTEGWKVATNLYQWSNSARIFTELYDDLIDRYVERKAVPRAAERYVSQIRRVAIEMNESLGVSDNPVLNKLFSWMEAT